MEKLYIADDEDVDNAASSWSGYMYQGKVAIYVVLKIINNNLNNPEILKEYDLRIEDLEDFVILYSKSVESIHQVKAKPLTNTIGSYNEANISLLGKLAKYKTVEKAYLHTATKIKPFTTKDLKKHISDFSVEGKKKSLERYKKNIMEKDVLDDLVTKLFVSKTCDKPQAENEYDCGITIDQIKVRIQSEIDYFFQNCGIEEIKELKDNCENIEYLYCELVSLIHERIHSFHLGNKELIEINLHNLYLLLLNEDVFTFSKKTFVKFILLQLTQDCIDYCHEEGFEEEEEKEFLRLWQSHVDELYNHEWDQIFNICLKLTPDYNYLPANSPDLESIRRILPPDGVKDSLFAGLNIFGEYIKKPDNIKEAYTFSMHNKTNLLTTINRKGKQAHNLLGQRIFENVKNNSQMLEILYEIDNYINTFINNSYDGNIVEVNSDVSSEVVLNNDNNETITSMKKITFVSIDKLSEEINND